MCLFSMLIDVELDIGIVDAKTRACGSEELIAVSGFLLSAACKYITLHVILKFVAERMCGRFALLRERRNSDVIC